MKRPELTPEEQIKHDMVSLAITFFIVGWIARMFYSWLVVTPVEANYKGVRCGERKSVLYAQHEDELRSCGEVYVLTEVEEEPFQTGD